MSKRDHDLDLITAYKVTRSDGLDYQTGTVLYEVGKTIEVPGAEVSEECCCPGLHLSPTARLACNYINRATRGPRARFFECLVDVSDLLAVASDKIRVRRLYVHRDVPIEEALPGVDFAGLFMPGQSNPWEPLVAMMRLGCAPLGYCRGGRG